MILGSLIHKTKTHKLLLQVFIYMHKLCDKVMCYHCKQPDVVVLRIFGQFLNKIEGPEEYDNYINVSI